MFKVKSSLACTESESMRDVIMHAHIFKNAGTTIDWILERNLRASFLDDRQDQRMMHEVGYLNDLLSLNPELKAISSHSLPLPVQSIPKVRFHTIVMLRHPLLRIRSVYQFERKQNASTPGAINAKKMAFREYVFWRMEPEVAPTIRDMHVRYLTRKTLGVRENLSEDYLIAACSYLDSNPSIGLVEKFDESMVVFSDYFKRCGIHLDFSYKKQNVSSAPRLEKREQITQLREDLGVDLFNILLAKNTMDLRLYEYAEKVVIDRFSSVLQAGLKLDEMRVACKAFV